MIKSTQPRCSIIGLWGIYGDNNCEPAELKKIFSCWGNLKAKHFSNYVCSLDWKIDVFCHFVVLSYRPFPSSLVPLFQSESKCETILVKMILIYMKMKLHAELIFIWKVSHLDSFWNRGTKELGNGVLTEDDHLIYSNILLQTQFYLLKVSHKHVQLSKLNFDS